MRNPKWHRDEIILALDLYFKIEPGQIHAKNPQIIELSEILNKLPIHEFRPDEVKFRNPNGVGLKLSNFLAIDPNYHGKGMTAFGKQDKEVFEEFVNHRTELASLAHTIRRAVNDTALRNTLYQIENEKEEGGMSAREGKVIYKLHKHFERNPKLNQLKKEQYYQAHSKLICEVCDFDFHESYGELGKGFMECHHKKPLAEIQKETITSLDDLALVCSNCHRMVHRLDDPSDLGRLKIMVDKRR